MTFDEQLQGWLAGEPRCPNDRGECCPDFSCCKPQLLQPLEVRRQFMAAPPAQRQRMLMGFLGSFVAAIDPKARVIGGSG
jgi:hypothetical protein